MKTFKRLLVVWVAVFFLLFPVFPVNKAFAGADLLIELGRWIPLGLEGLAASFSGSDSKAKKVVKEAQKYLIEKQEAEGREVTFGDLREQVIINKRANVLTFKANTDGKETLISIGFLKRREEINFVCYIIWDDEEEYKANSSKKALAARYVKYAGINVGPVDEEDPPKTSPATPAQPQPAPQSTPTATTTPETTPANTAPPAPSTALSNNP